MLISLQTMSQVNADALKPCHVIRRPMWERMMSSTVYLVVEPIELIATDLAMNVQDYDPSALVLVALSIDAACTLLTQHSLVRLAFVHSDPNGFSKTNLACLLNNRGAHVVFTGDAAERNDNGIFVLHRPFSAETTAKMLERTETSESARHSEISPGKAARRVSSLFSIQTFDDIVSKRID